MSNNHELKGLRGWLIVVGLGVVISPVRLLATNVPIFKPLFEEGTWAAMTTEGSEGYTPYLGPVLIGEIVFHSAIFIASLCLVYLFFTKRYLFPKFYMYVVAASLMFIPLDAWVVKKIFPGEAMFDLETTKQFMGTLIGGAIWIPYMLLSMRVKATFVEGRPDKHMQPTAESAG